MAPMSKSSEGQRFWLFAVEPVIELDHGGAGIGLLAAALAQFDERIGLRRTRRDHAARPVILEGAAHQVHAIGDQRGGQRIALVAGEALAVEGEGEFGRAVDQAALVRDGRRSCLRSLALRIVARRHRAIDLMRLGVARDDEPGAAAAGMMRIFVEAARADCRAGRRSRTTGPSRRDHWWWGGSTVASPRKVNSSTGRVPQWGHGMSMGLIRQCRFGVAPWPFSSSMWPVRNRSRR